MTEYAVRNSGSIATAEPHPEVTRNKGGAIEHSDASAVDWIRLVGQVQSGDPDGLDWLYRLFARGIRFHLCRQLGPQELDDRVHDTFLVVVQALQKGDLREPDRLMGFVRTIVRRQIASYIMVNVNQRRDLVDFETGVKLWDHSTATPETSVISNDTRNLIAVVLERLNDRDREILTRFYLYEQGQEQICEEMELSETQFRLLKSRAKARFGELGKKKVQQGALSALFMRTSAAAFH